MVVVFLQHTFHLQLPLIFRILFLAEPKAAATARVDNLHSLVIFLTAGQSRPAVHVRCLCKGVNMSAVCDHVRCGCSLERRCDSSVEWVCVLDYFRPG